MPLTCKPQLEDTQVISLKSSLVRQAKQLRFRSQGKVCDSKVFMFE